MVAASLTAIAGEAHLRASEIEGHIDSPLLGGKRNFGEESEPGIKWFLHALEGYRDSGISVNGEPIAVVKYRDALVIRVFGEVKVIDNREFVGLTMSLLKRPHRFRLHPTPPTVTTYNLVSIEKTGDSPLFKEISVGSRVVFQVGNMPCDLILDALTIPFAVGESLEKSSDDAVDPRVLLPHLGEQYGAGLLSKAVSWRLVDRGMEWPGGKGGEEAAIEVAKLLSRQCLNSPLHLMHGWCLIDLGKLADVAQSKEISGILRSVELEAEGVPEWLKIKRARELAEKPASATGAN